MNDQHDDTHEELLLSVACGDLARDDLAVERRATSCTECRNELEEQDALASQLGTWGEIQRQVRDDLAAGREVAGSHLVEPFVRARFAERQARHRPHRWAPVAAAAAVLVITAGGTWVVSENIRQGQPNVVLLNEGNLRLWSEVNAGIPTIFLDAKLPPRSKVTLLCLSVDGSVLLGPVPVDGTSWTPTSEQLETLGKVFIAEVRVEGPTQEQVDQDSCKVKLD